jgi:transmembrane sensor
MSGNRTNEEARLRDAADWRLRLRDPEIPDDVLRQWIEWSSHEENLAAFERTNALAEDVERLDEPSRAFLGYAFPRRRASRPWWPLAAAAVLVAMVVGGYLAWWLAAPVASRDYASALARHEDIRLPDGTRVALGGSSRLAARFDGNVRRVDLREGEAFFQVAPDDAPFEVSAGAVRIRDIGTAFDVRRAGERVIVDVAEGKVLVTAPGAVGVREAGAGQRIVFTPNAGLSLARIDPAQTAAWRRDRLEFDNEPLGVVVASINRYSARPVRIADARLAALSFTGTVRTDAIDRWLEALPQVLPLRVEMRAAEVVLSSRADAARQ